MTPVRKIAFKEHDMVVSHLISRLIERGRPEKDALYAVDTAWITLIVILLTGGL